MKTIDVPTRDQVSPESQLLFDVLQKRAGKVPDLYATIGHSPVALKAFIGLEDTLSTSVFSAKEREAIAFMPTLFNFRRS